MDICGVLAVWGAASTWFPLSAEQNLCIFTVFRTIELNSTDWIVRFVKSIVVTRTGIWRGSGAYLPWVSDGSGGPNMS